MEEKLIDAIVQQVMDKVGNGNGNGAAPAVKAFANPGMTEFVGTAFGDTIGIVIANVDKAVREKMGLEAKYRSIGILSGRTGAGPQIHAPRLAGAANSCRRASPTTPGPRRPKGRHP